MHCARPHVGPVQSHARLCRTPPNPYPLRIHGHQAHLRHSGEPLHPNRDGPDCLDRRPQKNTTLPPNHRPPWQQPPGRTDQKLTDHRHPQRIHQQHPGSSPTHPLIKIQSPRTTMECRPIPHAPLIRRCGRWNYHTHRNLNEPSPKWTYD